MVNRTKHIEQKYHILKVPTRVCYLLIDCKTYNAINIILLVFYFLINHFISLLQLLTPPYIVAKLF